MKNNKDLLTLLQEALSKEGKLRNCLDNIYILVNDGAVIMAGTVTHEALKKLATKIVCEVPGVNLFIDDLKVEPVVHQRVGVQIDWAKGRMALA